MYKVEGDEVASKVSRVGLKGANWNGSTLNLKFKDGTSIEIGTLTLIDKAILREGADIKMPVASLVFRSIPSQEGNHVTEEY